MGYNTFVIAEGVITLADLDLAPAAELGRSFHLPGLEELELPTLACSDSPTSLCRHRLSFLPHLSFGA
jgi:hypothetical protein